MYLSERTWGRSSCMVGQLNVPASQDEVSAQGVGWGEGLCTCSYRRDLEELNSSI